METLLPFPQARVPRLSLVRRDDVPRRFTVTYNTVRLLKERATGLHELWGCRFPNGRIALENLVVFDDMDELERHFDRAGVYSVDWLDKE